MSIAKYIKEIGRGKEGARSLTAEQAQDLMTQVLEGSVTDLEVGAFALAMRIKGETPAELAGFLAATRAHCLAPRPAVRNEPVGQADSETAAAAPGFATATATSRAVWLPSYNGARKLPNLTPLLALMLAREGVPVLVHGPMADPGRVTTAEIFQAMGLTVASSVAEVMQAWQRGEPAFMSTDVLCPPLARLLAVRRVVGLRNSGHTVAKVLLPPMPGHAGAATTDGSVFRVVNHTHPEYAELLSDFLAHTRADAMLLRGTEGEPVADARRTPRIEVFLAGQRDDAWGVPLREGVLTQLPDLPRTCDVTSTTAYAEAVLSGRLAAPEPITLQVRCIVNALSTERRVNDAFPLNTSTASHHESMA